MKTKIIFISAAACAMSACISDGPGPQPSRNREIILGVNSLPVAVAGTRAAGPVEEWDETEVGIAYKFDYLGHTAFAQAMTVEMADNDAPATIHTGLEYPVDNSAVSFTGYHPVMVPNAAGDVTYDLSRGDIDLMRTDILTGSVNDHIGDQPGETLVFSHLLTRVRFIVECAYDASFPEPIFGIRATGLNAVKPLMTLVTLDLDIENSAPVYQLPGTVFAGEPEAFTVPPFGNLINPKTLDMMFQPDVPVDFSVVSMSDVKPIVDDGSALWTTLRTTGGEQGKVYTIRLQFAGERILGTDISVTDWVFHAPVLPNDEGPNTWL